MMETLKRIGIVPGQSFDAAKVDQKTLFTMRFAVPYALGKLRQTALYGLYHQNQGNDWVTFTDFGRYGNDWLRRAVVANEFPGANVAREILYPFTVVDADGNPLTGEKRYILHFDAGQTPPVELLWSLSLYGEDHYLVPNEIKRYAIRSNQPLIYNQDGSLDLFIQHERPKEMETNWLPAPRNGFMLMLRLYKPLERALTGQWKSPPVKAVPAEKTSTGNDQKR